MTSSARGPATLRSAPVLTRRALLVGVAGVLTSGAVGGLVVAAGCSREVGRSGVTGTGLTQLTAWGYGDGVRDFEVRNYSTRRFHKPDKPVSIQVWLRNRSLTTPLRYRVRGTGTGDEGVIVVDPPLVDVTAQGTGVGTDGKGFAYSWSWAATAGSAPPEAIDVPPNSERVIVEVVWRPPKDTAVYGAVFYVAIAGERFFTGASTETFRK